MNEEQHGFEQEMRRWTRHAHWLIPVGVIGTILVALLAVALLAPGCGEQEKAAKTAKCARWGEVLKVEAQWDPVLRKCLGHDDKGALEIELRYSPGNISRFE